MNSFFKLLAEFFSSVLLRVPQLTYADDGILYDHFMPSRLPHLQAMEFDLMAGTLI
jgi:hypothetical protein